MRLALPVAAFAAGIAASSVLIAHAPQAVAVDRAQPWVVATNWGSFGFACWTVLAATLVAAYWAYVHVLRKPPAIAATCLAAAVIFLIAAFFVPIFSSDAYAYAAFGEMARLGIDPYHPGPLPPHDAVLTAATWQWQPAIPKCVYGPLFVTISRGVVGALATAPVATILAGFRILAMLALVACALPLMAIARLRKANPASAVSYVILHPVALWSAIEGHNDALMVLLAAGGMAIAARHRVAGAFAVACAALVKLPALGATFALAANSVVTRDRARETIAGTCLALLIFAAFSRDWLSGALAHAEGGPAYAPQASLQGFAWSLAAGAGGLRDAITVALTATVVVALLARSLWRFRRGMMVDGWTTAACAVWAAIPNPYPWYAMWLLPIAAFATAPLRNAVSLLALGSILRYVPDAAGTLSWGANMAASAVAAAPLALVLRQTSALRRSSG